MLTLLSATTTLAILLTCAKHSTSQLPVLNTYTPASGPTTGGTVVRVTGSGFSYSSACYFDSTSPRGSTAGVTAVPSNNATELVCTLPSISYPVNLSTTFTLFIRNGQGGVNVTVKKPFLVFNLSNIGITSISPNEGYNETSTIVLVRGTGFLRTGTISCTVDTSTNVPCSYVNTTLINCTLPPYPIAARQLLNITLNGDASGIIPTATSNATQFTFYYPAPVATSCTFLPSYAALQLQFDRAVEVGGEAMPLTPIPPNCSVVFDEATMAALGKDSTCTWYNSEQWALVINLAPTSNINLSTNITLRGDSIRTRRTAFSKLARQTLRVTQPSLSKFAPIAVVQGPRSIPRCGNLTLSAEYSFNGGYKPLQYLWTISPSNNFSSYPVITSNSAQLSIPSATLAMDELYTVQLSVQNFLGYNSTTSVELTWVESPSAPIVTILGETTRVVTPNQEVRLAGQATVPNCSTPIAGTLMYYWSITERLTGARVQVTMPNTSSIVIVPRILQAGTTYSVQLLATHGSSMGSATVQLVVTVPRMRALIDGGSRRVVCAGNPLVLNGAISAGLGDNSNVTVSWGCIVVSNYSKDMANEECGDNILDLLNVTNPKVVLPRDSLQLGVYRFVLTLQRGPEESSWTQDVTVVQQQLPTVLITPPPDSDAVVTSQDMVINATITSTLPGKARWINIYVQGFPPFNPINYLSPVTYNVTAADSAQMGTATSLYTSNSSQLANQVSLVLRKGSLLHSRNKYTFRLEVTDSANNTGFAEIDFYTGSVPTSGTMAILPTITDNYGPNPLLTLQAAQWLDAPESMPLSYQFGMYYRNTTYLLSGVLSQNYLNVVLPPFNSEVLMLFVRVYNSLGAYSEYQVAANGTQYSNFNATALLDRASYFILQQGNWADGLAQVATLAAAMNETPSLFRNFPSLRQNALQLALNVSLPQSKAFLNFQLAIVTQLTAGAVLPTAVHSSAVNFLELIVSSYNALDSPFSRPGFSSDEAAMALRSYGNLLGANFNVSGERVKTNVVSLSLTKNINAIGYGLCKQLGLYQEAKILEIGTFGVLKASVTNLDSSYSTDCSGNVCGKKVVTASFGSNLSQRYRNWNCTSDTTAPCSGVCVVASQLNQNFKWNGSNYAWITGSPLATITLLNRAVGDELSVSVSPGTSSLITIVLPVTTSNALNPSFLGCGYWNETLSNWSNQGCNLSNVSNGLAACRCTHLSQFAVVQFCPSGYFGENCDSVCPLGLWGTECQFSCACSNHGNCFPSNGSCNCDAGWTGASCNTVCTAGTWGKLCGNKCQCLNNATCDPVAGYCNCTPGWLGTTCNTSCPVGKYGKGCTQTCACRSAQQCDKATGSCTCNSAGYTGTFCNTTCEDFWYGVNCQQRCQCYAMGTAVCSRFVGTCTCEPRWTGTLCDAKIPEMLVETPFPVTAVVVPLLLVALVLALTIVIIMVMVKKKKNWGKKKVYPVAVTEEEGSIPTKEGIPMKSVAGGKVAAVSGERRSNEGSEISLDMTRAYSLDVLVPHGTKLKDLFPSNTTVEEFKEPPSMNGKQRWQIIQLTDSSSDTPTKSKKDPVADQTVAKVTKEGEERENKGENIDEVVYRQGVYLNPSATLRDLRNGFVETHQTISDHRMFLFLRSDILGDHFDISIEPGTRLTSIQGSLVQPWTVHIESLPRSVCQVDQCPCGRYAEMECSLCGRRGYCSEKCQKEDWTNHVPECTGVSKKEKKKKVPRGYTPNLNTCVCGKEADFECSICGKQGYCSEACQQKNWKAHSHYCKKEEPLVEQASGPSKPETSAKDLKDGKGLSPIPEESKETPASTGNNVVVSAGVVASGESKNIPNLNGTNVKSSPDSDHATTGGVVTQPALGIQPQPDMSKPPPAVELPEGQKDLTQGVHQATATVEVTPSSTITTPSTQPKGTDVKAETVSTDFASKQEDHSKL